MEVGLSPRIKNLLKHLVVFLGYTALGSVIFMAMENDSGEKLQRKESLKKILKAKLKTMYNITGDGFDAITQEILDAYSPSMPTKWDFNQGFTFVIQLVTTIGYGNIVPVTQAGRLFSIFYAFFGIIITVLTLQTLGENMYTVQRKLITKFHKVCLRTDTPPKYLPEKCLLVNGIHAILLILVGTAVEMLVTTDHEQAWTFVDGVYAWFITFTTIGFGDLIPGRHIPQYFAPVYTLIGLCCMSSLLNSLAACPHMSALRLMKMCASCCVRTQDPTIDAAGCQGSSGNDGSPNGDESKNEMDTLETTTVKES